ncbi:YbjN domain-containing protein [Maribrevibacterium harenarium]|nr:YbjN domain-containing protein [Maribrevibacterium harenarium]
MRLLFILVAGFVSLVSTMASADEQVRDRFADHQLVQLLEEDGYTSVSMADDGYIRVRVDGDTMYLLNLEDGDLQAYYVVSGVGISYADINEWNKTRRLSRAYLDDDRDPTLEADLLSNGGLTEAKVTEFFHIFTGSVDQFKDFLVDHDRS